MAYELFKGYIRTKDKMPLQKFKEADLLSLDEVSDADEYAGILNTETVLIDIDDREQSELLMRIVEDYQLDCKVLVTTRGRHFYFRNNGLVDSCHTKVKLACGLTADIKIGQKNSIAVLKYKDRVRPCEWDLGDYDKEDYAKLPKWLVPLKGVKTDLFGMSDGDGRNQELFAYILTLVNFGFDRNEAIDCLNIVNNYVFKTPLPKKEFETITREDAFPKATFMSGKQFDHTKFGDFLINSEHIAKINGLLHVYRNGVYVFGSEAIEKAMIANFRTIKSQQRTEVMKYIQIQAPSLKPSDARYIAFRNGVYDTHTQKLLPFSSDFVITNRIDWNFKANAGCEVTDRTLDKIACDDEEVRALLEECIGYGFYRRSELSKMFVLTGEKANGKSTFLEMLTHLYGDDNVSMLDIAELDERFSVSQLVGKLVNIGDDISDDFLAGRTISTLKKIVSGNGLKAEFKGENPFTFKPYCKLFFSANDIPRTKDKTGAVLRRLVIIPFNRRFSKSDPDYDPQIIDKLTSEQSMEYLIRIGLEGLMRVIHNNGFTEAQSVIKAVDEYELENNPILSFLHDVTLDEILNQSTDAVYRRYRVYCIENGFTEMTKTTFGKALNQKAGIITKVIKVNGKPERIYAKGG